MDGVSQRLFVVGNEAYQRERPGLAINGEAGAFRKRELCPSGAVGR